MDELATVQILRAQNALNMARESIGATSTASKAKAFSEIARITAGCRNAHEVPGFLRHSQNELVQKAGAHTQLSDVWADPEGQAMAQGFIASVDEPDLLSAIAKFSRVIPHGASRVLIASGATGDLVTEGFPKLVRHLDLSVGTHDGMSKCIAAVVVSQELLRATGEAGQSLFEQELSKAVIRACNPAVTASLVDSATTSVSAGSDPLASLRAGIRAAGPSTGFVIAAPAGDVAWLATHEANRGGMGVRGGAFVPGIELVAMDDLNAMVIIPASRLAVFTGPVVMHPAGHADVNMADSPDAPSEVVGLWQTSSAGLLVERSWRIDGDASGIVIVQ